MENYLVLYGNSDPQEKLTIEESFQIVGFESSNNNLFWVCKTKDGLSFNCKAMINNLHDMVKYIGAQLKISYEGMSEDNKPINPVGSFINSTIGH